MDNHSDHKTHKDHHHDRKDVMVRLRELFEKRKPLHKPRADLHEHGDLHPHHHNADHIRHHHAILHHHGKETAEERRFIDRENKMHYAEMARELCEDNVGQQMLNKAGKVSATPGLARDPDESESATPSLRRRKKLTVQNSSSAKVAEQLHSIRLRIAFARARTRERGEMTFGV